VHTLRHDDSNVYMYFKQRYGCTRFIFNKEHHAPSKNIPYLALEMVGFEIQPCETN